MSRTALTHGCKINYSLKVGSRLENGYHEIESIFLPVQNPCDRMEIIKSQGRGGVQVKFVTGFGKKKTVRYIDPHNNSLVTAYSVFVSLTGFAPKLDITVFKSIPVGAGLGGGSANAAALLLYLQQTAADEGIINIESQDLRAAAGSIGADIPFFFENKPAYVTGIGQRITSIDNPARGKHLLLTCPPIFVSTAWAYKELDRVRGLETTTLNGSEKLYKNTPEPGLTSVMHQANYSPLAGRHGLENDFEEVVFIRHPSLALLKQKLLDMGAETARLSGTGSSMFALFREEADRQTAELNLVNQGLKVYSQLM